MIWSTADFLILFDDGRDPSWVTDSVDHEVSHSIILKDVVHPFRFCESYFWPLLCILVQSWFQIMASNHGSISWLLSMASNDGFESWPQIMASNYGVELSFPWTSFAKFNLTVFGLSFQFTSTSVFSHGLCLWWDMKAENEGVWSQILYSSLLWRFIWFKFDLTWC